MDTQADAGHQGGGSEVTMRLVVKPGEPVSGVIQVDGAGTETPFVGWVELMAAINAARGAQDGSD